MAWKTAEEKSSYDVTFWDKENPKVLEGVYTEKKERFGKYFKTLYVIENAKGRFGVWSCSQIDRKLQGVEMGMKVSIEHLGIKPNANGSGSHHEYKVLYDDSGLEELD